MDALATGDVLDGKYQIVRELGSGAMGVIYVARHLALGRQVAVKVLRDELARDADLAGRFEQEARAASAIGHPNIIEVFDLGRTQSGVMYMVMELLEGRSLAQVLADAEKLQVGDAVQIIDQVLSALSAAHKHHIVHRDLKPDNIFVVENEYRASFVKLLDFGISKILDQAAAHIAEKKGTVAGTVMGTPEYMSPEQARGQVDQVDARTDLYAAGVVLYELLTGQTPFAGDNYNAVMAAIIEGTHAPVRQLRPGVPPRLEQIIETAMAPRREQRWKTAAAMRDALKAIDAAAASDGEGEAVLEFPEIPAEAAAETQAKAQAWAAGASATLLAVGGAGAGGAGAADVAGPPPLDSDDEQVLVPAGAAIRALGTPAPVMMPASASASRPAAAAAVAAARPAEHPDARFSAPDEVAAERALVLDTDTMGSVSPAARAGGMATPRPASRVSAAQRGPAARHDSVRWGRWIGLAVVVALVGGAAWAYPRYKHRLPFTLPWDKPPTFAVGVHLSPSSAEGRVDGVPLGGASVRLRAGPHVLTVAAPGYVARQVPLVAGKGVEVELWLARALAPIAARDPALPAGVASTAVERGAPRAQIDAALGKVVAYRDCATKISESTLAWREAFSASLPGRKGEKPAAPAALDSTLHFALETAVRCVDAARAQTPALPELDGAAQAFAASLAALAPLVERTGERSDDRGRAALAKQLAPALATFVSADAALWPALLLAEWRWQQAELAAIEHDDGKSVAWQLRRFVLAALTEQRSGAPAGADEAYDRLLAACKEPGRSCPPLHVVVEAHQDKSLDAVNRLVAWFDGVTTD